MFLKLYTQLRNKLKTYQIILLILWLILTLIFVSYKLNTLEKSYLQVPKNLGSAYYDISTNKVIIVFDMNNQTQMSFLNQLKPLCAKYDMPCQDGKSALDLDNNLKVGVKR